MDEQRNWLIWVGGGLLVGAAAMFLDHVAFDGRGAEAVGASIRWIVAPLVGEGPVTDWHVGLVYFLVLVVVVVVYIVAGRTRREDLFSDGASEDRSKKKNYRSDRVANLHWTWSWGLYGNVINLTPDCPECGTLIEIKRKGEGHCAASCQACGYEERWTQSRHELVEGVRAEINLRFENGKWKTDRSGREVEGSR